MNRKKIAVIFGTRPDTIKMAPIILELQKYPEHFEVLTIATAQHRQMLDQVLNLFEIRPAYDLGIMRPGQDLFDVTGPDVMDGLVEDRDPRGAASPRRDTWSSCRKPPTSSTTTNSRPRRSATTTASWISPRKSSAFLCMSSPWRGVRRRRNRSTPHSSRTRWR